MVSGGPASWRDLWSGEAGRRLRVLLFVIVLHAGGNYGVVTLAPQMVSEIGGAVLIGALMALFNIFSILAAVAMGVMIKRVDAPRLFLACSALFILGGLVCAAAGRIEIVAFGRALAGFGGGGMMTLGFIELRAYITPREWPKIAALSGVMWTGAAFAGPLFGGVAADLLGWRTAFAGVSLAGLAYAVAAYGMVASRPGAADGERLPLVNFFGLGAAVTAISFAPLADGLGAAACLIAGIGGLVLVVARERLRAPRLFPASAFRPESPQGRAMIAKLVLGAGAMSVLVFGPLALTTLHGFSATAAGAFVLIETVAWTIGSFIAASLAETRVRLVAGLGPVGAAFGLVVLGWALPQGHIVVSAAAIFACGAGLGLAWPTLGQRIHPGTAARRPREGGCRLGQHRDPRFRLRRRVRRRGRCGGGRRRPVEPGWHCRRDGKGDLGRCRGSRSSAACSLSGPSLRRRGSTMPCARRNRGGRKDPSAARVRFPVVRALGGGQGADRDCQARAKGRERAAAVTAGQPHRAGP